MKSLKKAFLVGALSATIATPSYALFGVGDTAFVCGTGVPTAPAVITDNMAPTSFWSEVWEYSKEAQHVVQWIQDVMYFYQMVQYWDAKIAMDFQQVADIICTINQLGGSASFGPTLQLRTWGAVNECVNQASKLKNIRFSAAFNGVTIEPKPYSAQAMSFNKLAAAIEDDISVRTGLVGNMVNDLAEITTGHKLTHNRGVADYAPTAEEATKVSASLLADVSESAELIAKGIVQLNQGDLTKDIQKKLADDAAAANAELDATAKNSILGDAHSGLNQPLGYLWNVATSGDMLNYAATHHASAVAEQRKKIKPSAGQEALNQLAAEKMKLAAAGMAKIANSSGTGKGVNDSQLESSLSARNPTGSKNAASNNQTVGEMAGWNEAFQPTGQR